MLSTNEEGGAKLPREKREKAESWEIPTCTAGSVFCLVVARSKMSGEFARSLGKGEKAL